MRRIICYSVYTQLSSVLEMTRLIDEVGNSFPGNPWIVCLSDRMVGWCLQCSRLKLFCQDKTLVSRRLSISGAIFKHIIEVSESPSSKDTRYKKNPGDAASDFLGNVSEYPMIGIKIE